MGLFQKKPWFVLRPPMWFVAITPPLSQSFATIEAINEITICRDQRFCHCMWQETRTTNFQVNFSLQNVMGGVFFFYKCLLQKHNLIYTVSSVGIILQLQWWQQMVGIFFKNIYCRSIIWPSLKQEINEHVRGMRLMIIPTIFFDGWII